MILLYVYIYVAVYVFEMMLIYIHRVTFVSENGLLKRYTDVCVLPYLVYKTPRRDVTFLFYIEKE